MKKLHIALLGMAILLLASCKEEVEKPKVIYDATNKGKGISKIDSIPFSEYSLATEAIR